MQIQSRALTTAREDSVGLLNESLTRVWHL